MARYAGSWYDYGKSAEFDKTRSGYHFDSATILQESGSHGVVIPTEPMLLQPSIHVTTVIAWMDLYQDHSSDWQTSSRHSSSYTRIHGSTSHQGATE
jgi:hypothetical protein